MSPKRKKKLNHQTHQGGVKNYTPHNIQRGSKRRGIRRFIHTSVDLKHILDWESDNYKEVYS